MKKTFLSFLFLALSFSLLAQSDLSESDKQELINQHNLYRQAQGVNNVQWSNELEQEAKDWAIIVAKQDKMLHSSLDFGENIYSSSSNVNPAHVVDRWASEKKFYHGDILTDKNYHLFGHYTQIIWSSTTKIGCAVAISKSGKHYWVCLYSTAGNVLGQRAVDNYKE